MAVTIGVLLHLPMFWMGHNNGFVLAGMPMDPGMIFGMYLIIAGVGAEAYGLLPGNVAQTVEAASHIAVVAPEDAKLGPAHWKLMAALVVALVIDVMKPASLGFTVPGMIKEYHASHAHASLVPFFALIGTDDPLPEVRLWTTNLIRKTAALTIAAPALGLINFGNLSVMHLISASQV